MHTLFMEEFIIPSLKNIAGEGAKLFADCEPRKSKNLLDFSKVVNDFSGLHGHMKVFFDPIAGHHKKLKKEDEQNLFVAISKKLDEMPDIYNKLPYFDPEEDEYLYSNPENSADVFFHLSQKNYFSQRDDINLVSKINNLDEDRAIKLLYYCVVLEELSKKVRELWEIMIEFQKNKVLNNLEKN